MKGIRTALQGYSAASAELGTSKAGNPYLRVRVGVTDASGRNDDENTTEWVSIFLTGEKATIRLAERLPKGAEIYAEGNLKVNRWVTSEGEERTNLTLLAWNVQPLGQVGRSSEWDDKRKPRDGRQEDPKPSGMHPVDKTWNDDDIPL